MEATTTAKPARRIRPSYTGVDGEVCAHLTRDGAPTARVDWNDPVTLEALYAELPASYARDLAKDLVANGYGPVLYAGTVRCTLGDFR